MYRREGDNGFAGGRFQWGAYGFMAGILVGVFMGWIFNGFVGTLVRLSLAAMVVVPIILLFLAWRRFVAPLLRPPAAPHVAGPIDAIETRGVVHGVVREPVTR